MNKRSREELRKLAEAATPGPWISHPKGYYGAVCRPDDQYDLVAVTHGQRRNNVLANEAYIAAANPAAILALLAEFDRLESQRDRLLSALKDMRSIVEIHSDATDNNFAWAEMAEASAAITEAESEQ